MWWWWQWWRWRYESRHTYVQISWCRFHHPGISCTIVVLNVEIIGRRCVCLPSTPLLLIKVFGKNSKDNDMVGRSGLHPWLHHCVRAWSACYHVNRNGSCVSLCGCWWRSVIADWLLVRGTNGRVSETLVNVIVCLISSTLLSCVQSVLTTGSWVWIWNVHGLQLVHVSSPPSDCSFD